MRQRAMSAGAAFSGSVATFCLGTALATGSLGPVCGFAAGTVAAAALARSVLRPRPDEGQLRLCPRRGVLLAEDGDGETQFRPFGVTHNLICLVRTGGRSERRAIWRDSLAPDGFRRIAAYVLWRRSAMSDLTKDSELIARKTVTDSQSAPPTGRPRSQ
jgi:hypothetical protein